MDNSLKFPTNLNLNFVEGIINGMHDWVRVIDLNNDIIFMNKSMSESLKGIQFSKKCYEYLNRDTYCEECISRKSILSGNIFQKEEYLNDHVYSVMSSPVRNDKGDIVAVVEVFRDITYFKTLQNKILNQNKKLNSQLDIARKLQSNLLPKKIFSDDFKYSYIYNTCEPIGGDFFDIFKIDEYNYGIYIADVSGHGVPASMLTVFLYSNFDKKTLSPSDAIYKLHNKFNRMYPDLDMYITLFYAILDVRNNNLVYSNAGHNACPIVFNENRFEILRSSGIPISNWLENPDYKDSQIEVLPDDSIFFYTDGIIEIKNKNDQQFGEDKLIDILLNSHDEPSIILNNIMNEAMSFSGEKNVSNFADDITMVLLKKNENEFIHSYSI